MSGDRQRAVELGCTVLDTARAPEQIAGPRSGETQVARWTGTDEPVVSAHLSPGVVLEGAVEGTSTSR